MGPVTPPGTPRPERGQMDRPPAAPLGDRAMGENRRSNIGGRGTSQGTPQEKV